MAQRDGSSSPQTPRPAASEAAGRWWPADSNMEEMVAERPRSLERIAEIAGLDTPALRAAWATRFGRPPPKSLSRRLLEYAASYHVQAKDPWRPEAGRPTEAAPGGRIAAGLGERGGRS